MATDKDKVMEMVEAELAKNPSISGGELYERAKEIDPAIGELNLRQFHARYPLQVKRRAAAAGGRRQKAAAAETAAAPATRGRRQRAERAPRRRQRAQATAETAPAAQVDRAAIRAALLQFAEAGAAADDAAQLVKVVGNVDRYVDRVAKAAGASG